MVGRYPLSSTDAIENQGLSAIPAQYLDAIPGRYSYLPHHPVAINLLIRNTLASERAWGSFCQQVSGGRKTVVRFPERGKPSAYLGGLPLTETFTTVSAVAMFEVGKNLPTLIHYGEPVSFLVSVPKN